MTFAEKMKALYLNVCRFTKIAFGICLAAFACLAVALILFSGFLERGEGSRLFGKMLCGSVYLAGSFFCIGAKLPLSAMIVLGIVLNLIGAIYWLPSLGTSEGFFAVAGIVLTSLWGACIALRIATANKAS